LSASTNARGFCLSRVVAASTLVVAFSVVPLVGASATVVAKVRPASGPSCQLNSPSGAIKHVIELQWDNVHFNRDNPNVPSDLEQMPHLLHFMENNGTLLSDHHTPLIAHTANDILTTLTGLYPDRHGMPIANSFDTYGPNGVPSYTSSFKYWTDAASSTDSNYNMIDAAHQNTPAPWATFTRAGCNVGAFGTANIELENTGSDINKVFGPNSPQAQEAAKNSDQATADFEGISIHCAKGSSICTAGNGGRPDVLPQEPGGYTGYSALFGAKYVAPYLTGGKGMKDLFGNPILYNGKYPGFPGFDPTPAQSLAYVAAMQEHGVPITYAYMRNAHDNFVTGGTFGPGEKGYVDQLKTYDKAFADFFANLAAHGINKTNTLFIITSDENDHFVGGPPSPANCDGVTVPCTYSKIGEIDADMPALLKQEFGITTPFDINFDSAPNFYLNGMPGQSSQTTRTMERAVGRLTVPNPITGNTVKAARFLADQTELRLLHMITSDPLRTPTFTMFGDPNYYWTTYGNCGSKPATTVCLEGHLGSAWNHGDVAPDINRTWLGIVGPGVRKLGVDPYVWSDHTDIRPTIMALVGLHDDYVSDGRVITNVLNDSGMTPTERLDAGILDRLGWYYKQINASVGRLALQTLRASTYALKSGSTKDDSTYAAIERQLADLTTSRNDLVGEMRAAINGAEFNGQPIDQKQARRMIDRAKGLLAWGADLASQYPG